MVDELVIHSMSVRPAGLIEYSLPLPSVFSFDLCFLFGLWDLLSGPVLNPETVTCASLLDLETAYERTRVEPLNLWPLRALLDWVIMSSTRTPSDIERDILEIFGDDSPLSVEETVSPIISSAANQYNETDLIQIRDLLESEDRDNVADSSGGAIASDEELNDPDET